MKSPSKLRPGERIFAVLLLLFSAVAFYEAYQISGFSGLTSGGVLPMLASAVMIISGVFILRDTFRRRASAQYTFTQTAAFLLSPRLILFVALLVLYAALMPWLGFILASAIFMFLAIAFLWRRSLLLSIAVTSVAMVVIYVIFRLVFKVVLPQGSLWL